MQGNIYRDVLPTFLTKKSYGWWITRRRMEIYTKYLKKRSKRVGAQISGSIKDHFAGENGVCEISQMHKRAAKSLHNNMLSSQGCEVGFHLEVLSSQLAAYIGNFRRKYTLLYKKAAKSLRNKRVISQHFAKCFLQLGVIDLQWLVPLT